MTEDHLARYNETDEEQTKMLRESCFAWTPDEEMERGGEEFRRLWPDKWEAWLNWCAEQDEP